MWFSNYSEYQTKLFNIIKHFRNDFLTPKTFKWISDYLNDQGYNTPRNTQFKPTHTFSIYKKGKIRLERMNRKDKVEVSKPNLETFQNYKDLLFRFNTVNNLPKYDYKTFCKNVVYV